MYFLKRSLAVCLWALFLAFVLGACNDNSQDVFPTPPTPDPTPTPGVVDLGTWSSATPMPTSRKEISNTTIELNGKIYVFGGIARGGVITNSLEIYDVNLDQWSSGSDLPVAVWRASAAVFDGKIYLIGGFTSISEFPYGPVNTVFEYNPGNDTWTRKSPMPTPRGSAVAIYYNNSIHVIGGANKRSLKTHEVYDPGQNKWHTGTPLQSARSGATGVVFRGNIYVIGGYTLTPHGAEKITRETELYNGFADIWKFGPELPVERKGIDATLLNDKIYVFGGSRGSNVSLTLQLDPLTHQWQPLAEMPTPIAFMGVSAYKNSIYVLGGSPISANGQSDLSNNRKFTPPAK